MKKENKGKKSKQKQRGYDKDSHDNLVTIAISEDLIILCGIESINLKCDERMWIIDSGITLHVTPRKEIFTFYISGAFRILKMSNDGYLEISHKKTIS